MCGKKSLSDVLVLPSLPGEALLFRPIFVWDEPLPVNLEWASDLVDDGIKSGSPFAFLLLN